MNECPNNTLIKVVFKKCFGQNGSIANDVHKNISYVHDSSLQLSFPLQYVLNISLIKRIMFIGVLEKKIRECVICVSEEWGEALDIIGKAMHRNTTLVFFGVDMSG